MRADEPGELGVPTEAPCTREEAGAYNAAAGILSISEGAHNPCSTHLGEGLGFRV